MCVGFCEGWEVVGCFVCYGYFFVAFFVSSSFLVSCFFYVVVSSFLFNLNTSPKNNNVKMRVRSHQKKAQGDFSFFRFLRKRKITITHHPISHPPNHASHQVCRRR